MGLKLSGRRTAAIFAWTAALAFAGVCDAQDQPRRGNRRASPVVALHIGTLHPVDGPAIKDAVVLMQRGRIQAVGPASEVDIPADAETIECPDAHAYPGLVDAMSSAFCGSDVLHNSSVDAGSEIADVLDAFDPRSSDLVECGITTAYVANRSSATWRGVGAVTRPRDEVGFIPLREAPPTALHLRMTAGPGASHPLARHKELQAVGKVFDELEDYEKARDDYGEKLATYEKDWAEYLAFYEKKQAKEAKDASDGKDTEPGAEKKAGATADSKPAAEKATDKATDKAEQPRRRGPRRGTGGERPKSGDDAAPDKSTAAKSADAAADSKDDDKDKDKAPKRPTFPKPPDDDPAKNALLAVRDGERALHVEAHRTDEIQAVLALKRERAIDTLILEGASAAAPLAAELAANGVPVLLTEFENFGSSPYGAAEDSNLLASLSAAKVDVALGSGDVRRARHLPLIAARAAALGLGEELALRAITLTPAEMLGIADKVGSVTAGKIGDILVMSGPLFASDSRILHVIAGGQPAFEAK